MAKKVPPKVPRGAPRTRRHAADLHKLSRTASLSYLRRAKEAAAPPNFPPLSGFAPSAIWEWFRSYLAYVFKKKHYFPDAGASPTHAMYTMSGAQGDDQVRIALAGDWGTGTQEAVDVAANMMKFNPHYTIHLGDVYYVGDPPEVNENCLGIKNPYNNYTPVTWPIGSIGSFALNGNHEMLANGTGYFDLVLPNVGVRGPGGGVTGQHTSFFCLENKYWRIIAIDTGYNSTGVPFLSQIPGINNIPWIGGDCKLQEEQISWLEETVKPQGDKRGLVLMAHHQYYSGFENRYRVPAKQLWKTGVQRIAVWFWGHEHRMAGYDLFGWDDLKVFGRCMGHGGMPIDICEPKRNPKPKFYDNRRAPNGFGMNGHVNMLFTGPKLQVSYVDVKNAELLREEWEVDANGNCVQTAYTPVLHDPDFHV